MKQRTCCLFLLCLCILPLFSLTAKAETQSESEIDGYVSEFFNAMPEEIADAYEEDRLSEMADLSHLLSFLLDIGESGGVRELIFSVMGLLLLFALASLLAPDGFGSEAERGVLIIAACVLFRTVNGVALRAGDYLSDLTTLSNAAVPAMSAITAAAGGVTSASAMANGMAWFLLVLQNVAFSCLLPLSRISFGFSAVSVFSEKLSVSALGGTLRRTYMVLLGFLSALLLFSLSAQTTLAASADSLAKRTAGYAIGSFLPVVGGTVSAALGTAMGAVSAIASTVGTGGAIAVLCLLLPLLLELLLLRTAFSLASGAGSMLGTQKGAALFAEMRGVTDMIFAGVAIPSLVFLLITAVFARTVSGIAL